RFVFFLSRDGWRRRGDSGTGGPLAAQRLLPPRRRATVQAIYSSGIAVGAGLAFFLGGWIGQHIGWRWAFYLLGFPGLFIAKLVFLLKEKNRVAKLRRPRFATAARIGRFSFSLCR